MLRKILQIVIKMQEKGVRLREYEKTVIQNGNRKVEVMRFGSCVCGRREKDREGLVIKRKRERVLHCKEICRRGR